MFLPFGSSQEDEKIRGFRSNIPNRINYEPGMRLSKTGFVSAEILIETFPMTIVGTQLGLSLLHLLIFIVLEIYLTEISYSGTNLRETLR